METSKPKVLIVDDERHICSVLAAYLDENGFEAIEAHDLLTARHHLKTGLRPDVIVCDVMLTDGNGIVFVRELRQDPILSNIPIIIMSAHRTKSQDKVVGLEFGADDYLTKPFDLRELQLRIEKLIKQPREKIDKKPEISVQPSPITGDMNEALQHMLKKSAPPPAGPKPSRTPSPSTAPSAATNPNPRPPSSMADSRSVPSASLSTFGHQLCLAVRDLALQPRHFFEHQMKDTPSWLSLVLVAITGVLYGWQHGFSEKSVGVGFLGTLVYPSVLLAFLALVSWGIHWKIGFNHQGVSFKKIFQGLGWAVFPLALSGLLGLFYVALAGGRFGDFTAGPLLFLPHQSSSRILGFLLRRVDIFELGTVWLASGALTVVLGGKRQSLLRKCLFTWVVGVLLVTLGWVLLQ